MRNSGKKNKYNDNKYSDHKIQHIKSNLIDKK